MDRGRGYDTSQLVQVRAVRCGAVSWYNVASYPVALVWVNNEL
jgi:hypothetical protein